MLNTDLVIRWGIKMVFGIEISIISTLSLIIQILSFTILLFAAYKRKEDILMHGRLARIAFFIALPSFSI